MLHANGSLARRIESAECELLAAVAGAARARGEDVLIEPISGGVAIYTGADSPYSKVAGLGFELPLDEGALERIEAAFGRRRARLQVELSSLGDGTIGTTLTRRGYHLVGFENVMGRAIAPPAAPPDLAIIATLAGPDESARWIDIVTTGFEHPDLVDGPSAHESFSREAVQRTLAWCADVAAYRRYLARIEGAVAGGASLFAAGRVALLCGAATLPDWRRRGVQTALLRARLDAALDAGCDMAVVTIAQPGSKSQENARRQGFELLYTRAILVREPFV